MRADLHIHSTVSDGSEPIPQIVRLALEAGLDAISITDHDTLSHIPQIPPTPGLAVVPGAELSAADRKTGVRAHILAYLIKDPNPIEELAGPVRMARHENTLKQIDMLRRHGFEIDMVKLRAADGKYLYKQHVMDYLVSTGQADEMFGLFYRSVFKNGGICDFDIEYPDAFDAVKAVKAAGGLAVLAHPGQQQNFRLVPALAACGLDGIELNHHSHTEKDKEIIMELASRHRLFMTGGSDFHGRYEPQKESVGDVLSHSSGLAALGLLPGPQKNS